MPKQARSKKAILAKADTSHPYNRTAKRGGGGTFSTLLEVYPHDRYNSVSRIDATFHLQPAKEPRKTRMPKEEVGTAVAFIFDKTVTAATQRNKRKQLWLDELNLTERDEELELIMEALYGPAGGVKQAFKKHRGLKANRIVYLAYFKLHKDYRRRGLGSLSLESFHECLPELSNGFGFQGTVVLSPATPDDAVKDFKKLTKYEQEGKLIEFYESVGYALWLRGDEDAEDSYTVMGRTVELDDEM